MLIQPSYAKINLALDVVARRPDGWHELESILVPIDWHDLVAVRVRPSESSSATLRLTGEVPPDLPDDDTNLALRAVARLSELARVPLAAEIWVDKRVPVEAGLGGGSSNAATVLRSGAAQLAALGVHIDHDALTRAAMQIGSDVPALLAGGAQRVRGLGERLEPLTIRERHLAVAVAGASSTAASYSALQPSEITESGRIARVASALREGGLRDDDLGSALEAGARRAAPLLAQSIERLRALTPARRWHLTGSGGALFCVAQDTTDAASVAARVREHGFASRACHTVA